MLICTHNEISSRLCCSVISKHKTGCFEIPVKKSSYLFFGGGELGLGFLLLISQFLPSGWFKTEAFMDDKTVSVFPQEKN